MISGVLLAAMIPAMRATLNTSPFWVWPSRRREKGRPLEKYTLQVAVASRGVTGLEVIWVMCTFWEGVRCGRSGSEVVGRDVLGLDLFSPSLEDVAGRGVVALLQSR